MNTVVFSSCISSVGAQDLHVHSGELAEADNMALRKKDSGVHFSGIHFLPEVGCDSEKARNYSTGGHPTQGPRFISGHDTISPNSNSISELPFAHLPS